MDDDPDERLTRLVRPYIGSGGPASAASADDGGGSAWFPAPPPFERDTAPSAPAGSRQSGTAGRHQALPAAPHRWFRAAVARQRSRGIRAAEVAAAGIAVLTVGVFLVWSGHPATGRTPRCRPDGCGGTVSQALGTGPAQASASASASAGAHSAASASAGQPATAQVRAPASATAAPSGTATAAATATATSPASATRPAAPPATDAATSPAPSSATSAPQLAPGSLISINATTACCTAYYIQHDNGDNRVVITDITQGSSALSKADATWLVQAGLADSACISFESANDPGQYLRHFEFELYLEPNDGSSQFAQDATFCPRPGNSGKGYSFQSVNYTAKYIRHFDYAVYIASDGGSNPWDGNVSIWPDDTTWLVTQPWG
jgi:hypothetical protein